MSRPQRKPCTCGGEVTANPDDPTPGVRAHVLSEPHRTWSDMHSLVPYRETTEPPLVPTIFPRGRDVSGFGQVRPGERRPVAV